MHPIKSFALKQIADHRDNLEQLLIHYEIKLADLTHAIMSGKKNQLAPELLVELTYIDAYTKLINLDSNPVDPADWGLKQYLDLTVTDLYAWAAANPTFHAWAKSLDAGKGLPSTKDDEFFSTIALLAIKREDDKNGKAQEGEQELSDGSPCST